MSRTDYYEDLKDLVRQVRAAHNLTTPRVLRSDLNRIYKQEGIQIDQWPHRLRNLRGAYFYDEDCGASVMIAKKLPDDPYIFTLAHELKHHLVDREMQVSYCTPKNISEPIEIGAEVFAAELIFPEPDFATCLRAMGVGLGQCCAETLVRLKHDTRTTLSYAGLAKRATFLRFAPPDAFVRVAWKKLEEQMYGEPIYKRMLRRRRSAA